MLTMMDHNTRKVSTHVIGIVKNVKQPYSLKDLSNTCVIYMAIKEEIKLKEEK